MKVSKFERMIDPPPVRLTERDINLIKSIQSYGGFLTIRHIRQLFFAGKTRRTMERRLSILFNNHYLERPTLFQRRTKPIPEAIYWLGWKGILLIAALNGVKASEPTSEGVNQIRNMEKQLRSLSVYWLREPHWVQLRHDIKVIDVRLIFEDAVEDVPALSIAKRINEHNFRADHDRIKAGKGKKKRGVIPDMYLLLLDEQRRKQGDPEHKAHLLFEIDMATRDNPRFEREKLQAYAAYIGSPAFKERFSSDTGSWLLVTTGKRRMRNLMHQTLKLPKEKWRFFYFSTFHQVEHANPLTNPIWWKPTASEARPLLPENNLEEGQLKMVYKATA